MDILKQYLKTEQPGSKKPGYRWVFQGVDNDPKYTVLLESLQNGLKRTTSRFWSGQSPELNPIEHLWEELEKHAQARRPTILTQFYQFCQEEWANFPATYCEKPLEGYPQRLTQVKQ